MSGFSFKVFSLAYVTTFDEAWPPADARQATHKSKPPADFQAMPHSLLSFAI